MDSWSAGALGSCRVHTPLAKAAAAGLIDYRIDAVIGFIHNPLEIGQAVALLRGERIAPPELCALMSIAGPQALGQEDRFAKLFSRRDVLVVEISSLRIVAYDGWQLQLHRFRETMLAEGFAPSEVSALFRPSGPARETLAARARTPLLADILRRGRFHEMGAAELDAALATLREAVDMPTLFLGTLTHNPLGAPIAQRVLLRDAMLRCARRMKHTASLDPTGFVGEQGYDYWMRDLGHYRPEREAEAGRQIVAALAAFGRNDRMMQYRRLKRELRAQRRAALAQDGGAAALGAGASPLGSAGG